MARALRFANFISGGGSTNLAVLNEEMTNSFPKTETVVIISSSPDAGGIAKAIKAGFSWRHIHVLNENNHNEDDLAADLLDIVDKYAIDHFHQLGWLPKTPIAFLKHYNGLNQHLGPGGRWMKGRRRIWTHLRFCQQVNRRMPIPVFCQFVDKEYDAGDVVSRLDIDIPAAASLAEIDEIADQLLLIEHQVQINGRKTLARGKFTVSPAPQYALNEVEAQILLNLQKQSCDVYPDE